MAYYSADPEKHEHELYDHVRKAVLIEEKAPKQKHVRAVSAYTWIHKNSVGIWNSLKMLNVLTNEVQSFKALITIHSLLRDGHPNVLPEAMKQKNFLESFKNSASQNYGYGTLIRNYVDFLYNKLALHSHHLKFTGNFGYKDVSVREFDYKSVASYETADLNEGYVTVEELMDLQNAVDAFQKSVFKSFARGINNNCRISALVPLVEESYGLYLFLTNMLQSLHRDRAAWDALEPLRDRYNDQFWMLKHFYDEARKLPYLTSLIIVPRLPNKPPEFYILSEKNHYRPEVENAREITGEPPRLLDEDFLLGTSTPTSISSNNVVDFEVLHFTENALNESRARNAELESLLNQYATRMEAMNGELDTLRSSLQEGQFSWDRLRQLETELRDLRSKYDKLAKAYAQLNADYQTLSREHSQCGEWKSQVEFNKKEMEAIRRAKDNELATLARERDQCRTQMEAQRQQTERLTRDLEERQQTVDTLSRAKGDEVQSLIKTSTAERVGLERARDALVTELDTLRAQLVEKDRTLKHLETDQLAIMDAGLEESARRIHQLEQRMLEQQQQHTLAIATLHENHSQQLDKVLGAVMDTCRTKIKDALTALDDPNASGNILATPESALIMGEKLLGIGGEFTEAFLKFLRDSAKGLPVNEADAIAEAQALATAMEQLLVDAKGTTRLTDDEGMVESITSAARSAGKAAFNYFSAALPTQLRTLEPLKVDTVVMECNERLKTNVHATMKSVEQLLSKENARVERLEGDLADVVEKEMMEAARAIDDATQRLLEIMARQQQQQSLQGDATQLSVHASLLDAAMAMMKSIGTLVKAATTTQKEIVTSSKGLSTATQFYKKNHRWTDGLISAAKMVAAATIVLVEVADGVVGGSRSMEDLIAASKEVSAATAQLVAAARVKMVRGSRTQEPLENASRAIGEAVRNLVNAADKAIKQRQQQVTPLDFSQLSLHEMKIRELEVQSKILALERQAAEERRRLAEMRRSTYHTTM